MSMIGKLIIVIFTLLIALGGACILFEAFNPNGVDSETISDIGFLCLTCALLVLTISLLALT